MAWATKTHDFSAGTTAKSQEVDDNFDDMVDQLNVAMPSGGIIMWSGSVASIPTGWYLCNGSNSTPNLQDRFVIGAGSSYSVDSTGGASTVNLAHSHTVNNHTHTIYHTHNYSWSGNVGYSGDLYVRRDLTATVSDNTMFDAGNYRGITSSHRHSLTVSGTTGGSSSSSSGGSAPGTNSKLSSTTDNKPPYYAIAYIMKS